MPLSSNDSQMFQLIILLKLTSVCVEWCALVVVSVTKFHGIFKEYRGKMKSHTAQLSCMLLYDKL